MRRVHGSVKIWRSRGMTASRSSGVNGVMMGRAILLCS